MADYELRRHPLSAIFPDLEPEDHDQLVESIRRHGVLSPIILSDGMVLDGWHRYQIAKDLGIPEEELKFLSHHSSIAGEVEQAIAYNLARRHLRPEQRAAFALKLAEEDGRLAQIKAEAAAREQAGVALDPPSRDARVGKTADAVAKLAGVSTSTVERVQRAAKANPDALEQIATGKATTLSYTQKARERAAARRQRAIEQDLAEEAAAKAKADAVADKNWAAIEKHREKLGSLLKNLFIEAHGVQAALDNIKDYIDQHQLPDWVALVRPATEADAKAVKALHDADEFLDHDTVAFWYALTDEP